MLADRCPNQFPNRQAERRLAIVAECPGLSEVSWATCIAGHEFETEWNSRQGHGRMTRAHCPTCGSRDLQLTPKPLVGASGQKLNQLLAEAGIAREECFVGNVCQVMAPGNEVSRFGWEGPQIQEGLRQLRDDLVQFQPHMILTLGGTALRAICGQRKSVDDWRGSLFTSDFTDTDPVEAVPSVKCLPTYHPARLLREADLQGVVRMDLQRCREELRTDGLNLPIYDIQVTRTKEEVLLRLSLVKQRRTPVAPDIEGGLDGGVACIGYATSPTEAFVIPIRGVNFNRYWSKEDEAEILAANKAVMEDTEVVKIFMNAAYEKFVLKWLHGMQILNLEDIMLRHHELYCELPKELAFQASIYTRQPFWKLSHRKVKGRYVPFTEAGQKATDEDWYRYNGIDCCVTMQCWHSQEKLLKPRQREHLAMQTRCLEPLHEMMMEGMPYDGQRAGERCEAVKRKAYGLQDRINREAAASGQRPKLAAFYRALSPKCVDGDKAGPEAAEGVAGEVSRTDPATALIPLLTEAFCQVRRTEKREVTETSWQPMRWNGKKWVKAGKRITDPEVAKEWLFTSGCDVQGPWKDQPPTDGEVHVGLRVVTKTILRNVPVEIRSLEDVSKFGKGSSKAELEEAIEIVHRAARSGWKPAIRGRLATLLGIHIKLNASGRKADKEGEDGEVTRGDEKDANWLLYELWKFPRQFKKEGRKNTDKLTSDTNALLNIWLKTKDRRTLWFLVWRGLDTRRETLEATADKDGQIRCSLNVAGTETVRLSCSESPTGSGFNLQTVSERDRDLFGRREGWWFGQLDLRGADSYTIALRCALQGDETMLEDLLSGLKVQSIVALTYLKGMKFTAGRSREELKELIARYVDEKSWLYKASKNIFYGSSYGIGADTTSATILKGSYKRDGRPLYVSPEDCRAIQERAFFARYWGVKLWHRWAEQQLMEHGTFTSFTGHRRQFFGRKKEWNATQRRWECCQETLRAFLAHEPQFNTTWAVKTALLRLWDDPSNRREDGERRVKPLHTVHDSLNPAWRYEDHEYAVSKFPEWFQNPIEVGGRTLVIPYSGSYGVSWGEQSNKLK